MYKSKSSFTICSILKCLAACFSGQKVRGVCKGDSGSPIFWEDKTDNDKTYLMSVVSKGSNANGMCNSNKKYLPTSGVWVPAIQDWISTVGGPELNECSPWVLN